MEINMARQLVIRAGKELVESGLIARTWGNVSCRIDDMTFAITPSGRSYETLRPEEIVICQTPDASYEGDIKPSSEKRIHALVYCTYPEVNFVIHTHQPMASIISAAELSSMPSGNFPLLEEQVPIAAYGLPGTKQLRGNIDKVLRNSKSHAVIMANHGALCFGRNYEETFAIAKQLEEACEAFLHKAYLKASEALEYDEKKYYQFYASNMLNNKRAVHYKTTYYLSSRRTMEGFILEGKTKMNYCFSGNIPPEAVIHRDIYLQRKDINCISQDLSHGLLELSQTGSSLKPLLDDFAQIVGGTVRCANSDSSQDIRKALGKRMGVLVPGCGALCAAGTESDLHAVRLVMEKNSLAEIGTRYLRGGKTIGFFDSWLMHFVYSRSYAKKANQSVKVPN